jgi:hypothetical protein
VGESKPKYETRVARHFSGDGVGQGADCCGSSQRENGTFEAEPESGGYQLADEFAGRS